MVLFLVLVVIVILCALIILVYSVNIYNFLINLKNNIKKAWANIDVLLKQRHDEIPKLLDVCSGYMQYEKETLESVIKARNMALTAKNVDETSKNEGALSAALGKLFALSEKYPDLKANENFAHLRSRISQIESQIADRREFYNDSVNNYNIKIAQIPDVFIANFLNYQPEQMFKITEEDKQDVQIKFNMPK